MPERSVLCLETTAATPDVVAFLERHWLPDPPAVAANTLRPKPSVFHLPIAGSTMGRLLQLAEAHRTVEVADHLTVYRDARVLLLAHDAGYGRVLVSRALGDGAVARLRAALADPLPP
jgi:hypothetical protein